ncbi:MAG: DUF4386 domain-containing protein [Dehalococcoidia bacterium]
MTTVLRTTATNGIRMDASRKSALVAGVLFILTFITSIPELFLYHPVLKDAGYIVGAGADTRALWGAFLEVILAFSGIGTALALFSVLRREHEGMALGYVATRVIESTIIVIGVISVLSVVTLRQYYAGAAGADAAALLTVGRALVAIHDWTFLLGPGLIGVAGNGMLLGYLMYRSALVPRRMALLGLIGGPLVCASGIAVLFGLYQQVSPLSAIATIPEFFWELSLGIWLTVKGFNAPAFAVASPKTATHEPTGELVSVG